MSMGVENIVLDENYVHTNPLKEPSKHDLIELFKELKFGRPRESQMFLNNLINAIEKHGLRKVNDVIKNIY